MLIYINKDTRYIWGHNPTIEKEDAQKYVDGIGCLWIDGLEINIPEHTENQAVDMYLNEDNTIRYEVNDIVIEENVTLEKVYTDVVATKDITHITSEDALLLMEMLVVVDEKINTLLNK